MLQIARQVVAPTSTAPPSRYDALDWLKLAVGVLATYGVLTKGAVLLGAFLTYWLGKVIPPVIVVQILGVAWVALSHAVTLWTGQPVKDP